MIISFFEEFPVPRNLSKGELVTWPSRLFIAAKTISEFQNMKRKIKNKNIIDVIYWPVLPEQEGYWISPWVDEDVLTSLFRTILSQRKGFSVMLDLEPPKEVKLYPRCFTYSFHKKKRIIQHFLGEAGERGINVYTVESAHIPLVLRRILGVSFPSRYRQKRIVMYYTSFLRTYLPASVVEQKLAANAKRWSQQDIIPALGLIAPGIYKNELTYGLSELKKEVEILKKAGIKEVIIFRLGGLHKEHVRPLKVLSQQ